MASAGVFHAGHRARGYRPCWAIGAPLTRSCSALILAAAVLWAASIGHPDRCACR
ncbi:hypothetical protein ACTMU2_11120 [Cupriavidus basilensis]